MNEKQKDNTAKLLYDFCKIIFAVAVVGPIVQQENLSSYTFFFGLMVSVIFYIFAYIVDRKKD